MLGRETVRSLQAFVDRWPDAADAPAARDKIHALYTKLRADTPLLASVFAWLEDHGTPPIAVRLRLRRGRSLAEADELLEKSLLDDGAPATGGRAPASPSFGDDSAERYAAAAAKALESGLRELVFADVFVLRPGAAPAGDAPSIDIDAEIVWSGLTYVGRSLHRRFVGIAVNVVATFHAKQAAAIGVRVETPDTFDVAADATNDGRVYELMTTAALGRLASAMKNASFRNAGAADAAQGDEL